MYFFLLATSFAYPDYSHLPLTQTWIYADSGGDNGSIYGFSVPNFAGEPWASWQPVTDLGTSAGPTVLGIATLQGGYTINNMYGGDSPPETEIYTPTITIAEL
jgi:hypothetical protein